MRKVLSFMLFIFLCCPILAQEADSTQYESKSTFRKGRWFTGLSGTISTSSSDNPNRISSGNQQDIFGYSLDITTGKFLADQALLGLVFYIEKENTNDVIYRDVESYMIGPFFRYYFSDSPIGSIYSGLAVGYSHYFDTHNTYFQNQFIDEKLNGNGIGLIGELGYGLNIKDNVSFDLSINYLAQHVSGTINDYQNEEISTSFWRRNFYFKFGFNVILDEFFF